MIGRAESRVDTLKMLLSLRLWKADLLRRQREIKSKWSVSSPGEIHVDHVYITLTETLVGIERKIATLEAQRATFRRSA